MATISGDVERLILCRMVENKALRTLEVCKLCPQHGGVEEQSPAGQLVSDKNKEGLPARYRVICNLPTKIQVIDLIRENEEE